jgi:hypothetical protein
MPWGEKRCSSGTLLVTVLGGALDKDQGNYCFQPWLGFAREIDLEKHVLQSKTGCLEWEFPTSNNPRHQSRAGEDYCIAALRETPSVKCI